MPARDAPQDGDLPFPAWFRRMVVGAVLGLFLQFAGAVWWAATITTKMDSIEKITSQALGQQKEGLADLKRQVEELEREHRDDLKFVDDRFANIKKDLGRLDARTEALLR